MENKKILGVYCLFDNEIKTYDGLVFCYSDEAAVSFYLEQFGSIIISLSDRKDFDEQKDRFMEKIHNSSIFKVATFDNISGTFINESSLLVNLFDVNTDDILAKKIIIKESEEIKKDV